MGDGTENDKLDEAMQRFFGRFTGHAGGAAANQGRTTRGSAGAGAAHGSTAGSSESSDAPADRWLKILQAGGPVIVAACSLFPSRDEERRAHQEAMNEHLRTLRQKAGVGDDPIGTTLLNQIVLTEMALCRLLTESAGADTFEAAAKLDASAASLARENRQLIKELRAHQREARRPRDEQSQTPRITYRLDEDDNEAAA